MKTLVELFQGSAFAPVTTDPTEFEVHLIPNKENGTLIGRYEYKEGSRGHKRGHTEMFFINICLKSLQSTVMRNGKKYRKRSQLVNSRKTTLINNIQHTELFNELVSDFIKPKLGDMKAEGHDLLYKAPKNGAGGFDDIELTDEEGFNMMIDGYWYTCPTPVGHGPNREFKTVGIFLSTEDNKRFDGVRSSYLFQIWSLIEKQLMDDIRDDVDNYSILSAYLPDLYPAADGGKPEDNESNTGTTRPKPSDPFGK